MKLLVAVKRVIDYNVKPRVKMDGSGVDLGKRIMADSGLPIVPADDLADAAAKVVDAVGKAA